MKLSDLYRRLPHFKGKYRLGKRIFKNSISQKITEPIKGKNGIFYNILNTHDSVGRDLFFDGIYEPQTISLIKKLLQADDVFIDAGANIGAISVPVAAGCKTRVFAFEPGTEIGNVLKQNVQRNHLHNIEVVEKALSHENGRIDFYESDRVHGWSGAVKIDSFRNYKVDAITLDEFCAQQQISQIRVLKMDVQGWEYHVLCGARKLLEENKIDHIIFEFEWWAEENAGLQPGAAQEFLLSLGYVLRYLNGQKLAEPLRKGTVMLWATKE